MILNKFIPKQNTPCMNTSYNNHIFLPLIGLLALMSCCFLFTNVVTVKAATEILTSIKTNQQQPGNNKKEIASSAVSSEKNTLLGNKNSEYFVKIKNEIIPIEINVFSSKKTILEYSPDQTYSPEIENINICNNNETLPNTIYCNLTTTFNKGLNIRRRTIFKIDQNKFRKYLTDLNETIKKSPQNVRLSADENENISITTKEVYGYELDIDNIVNNSLQYFNRLEKNKTIVFPLKIIPPLITSQNYQQMGIRKKIGHGESNFRGSPRNRIHNIHNATGKFEGIVIPPNETFSFVKNLGAVDASTGYKEELVIKNHKTIPEFGGGVCQVSTTLFRAAINTGLKITERRNHAYPVSYYSPQGTDATIYIPKPDLQFTNDTPGYILIQPYFNGTILSFDIFGTPDGRQVKTEGPILLKRTTDGGRKYVYYQIIKDKDGKQIAKNGFWSFYQNAASFHDHQTEVLTSKPKKWSNKEWKRYKREHGM